MCKKLIFIWACILLSAHGFAQQNLTLDDIWASPALYAKPVEGFNFMNDGKSYTAEDPNEESFAIIKYDFATGNSVDTLFEASQASFDTFPPAPFEGYTLSTDERKILLYNLADAKFRYSFEANYFVWDTKNNTFTAVSNQGKQREATLSPDGSKVAFVRSNNLFVKNLVTGKEQAITSDGKMNSIINGVTDWVYEEEFGFTRAFEWNADGSKIAFLRFDESQVPEFNMPLYHGTLYPQMQTFKYPKAGEKNAQVTLHIADIATLQTRPIPIGTLTDYYIPRIKWTLNPQILTATYLNRHQNDLQLFAIDATQGSAKTILHEQDACYIDITDDLTFLQDKKHFLWTSAADGYNHIYQYTLDGKNKEQLTQGSYDITKLLGVDEPNGLVYYEAAKHGATQRHIYSLKIKNKKERELIQTQGIHHAQFSSTFSYFVDTWSDANTPPTYTIYKASGEKVRTIEDNQPLRNNLKKYNLSTQEFFQFTTADNVTLNGWMIKPTNFDPTRKYPVLLYVYGGPGAQTVLNQWGGANYLWFQMLAQKGYLIVSVDNRGTPARGSAFLKSTYLQLGKNELIDQSEVARYLARQTYVDAKRIGIFGWSYGGYLSSLCILKAADLFKAAIAVAPVTNWKWYDSIYTERFMRTPTENPSGFEENSPVNFAHKLQGAYLLIHGTADDNVHFQNTVEMTNALINANKQFDTYFYPNRNHGIYGGTSRMHLYTKMTDFLLKNL
jgi:dipeptidyl-peptidase-4